MTVIVPPSITMPISRGSCRESSPFGPVTVAKFSCRFTVTPSGTEIGFLPIRDINPSYQTWATYSPPRRWRRASRSLMMPRGVDRMAMPNPFFTRGISRAFT